MTVATPALIFVALADGSVEAASAGRLALAAGAGYLAALALSGLGCRLAGLDGRTFWAPLAFGNTGNLGLPLALLAFGEAGLGYAVVVLAVSAVIQFTLGLMIVAGTANPASVLREPMVLATLAGALVLATGWEVPQVALSTLGLLGQMAVPMMLITLGVAVARLTPGRVPLTAALSAVKIAGGAGIGAAAGWALGLGPTAFAVLVVQMSTPVAVTSYLLAERYGADAPAVASLVVVSTAMSVATLPLILALFVA
jgi:predicted permease